MGVGSDAGVPGNPVAGALLREMEAITEGVGLSPLAVIQLATLHNARLLRLTRAGQIRKGYAADIAVLRRDPTRAIEAVADVVMVIANGRVAVDHLHLCPRSLPRFF